MTIWLDCFADNPVTGIVVLASDQSPIAGANVLFLKSATIIQYTIKGRFMSR